MMKIRSTLRQWRHIIEVGNPQYPASYRCHTFFVQQAKPEYKASKKETRILACPSHTHEQKIIFSLF